MLQEIIGDLPVVTDNNKFLAKFHSGTLRTTDTMRLMSLFKIIVRTSVGICLNISSSNGK